MLNRKPLLFQALLSARSRVRTRDSLMKRRTQSCQAESKTRVAAGAEMANLPQYESEIAVVLHGCHKTVVVLRSRTLDSAPG